MAQRAITVRTRVRPTRPVRSGSKGAEAEITAYATTILAVALLVTILVGISAGVTVLLACGGGFAGGWRWERKRRSRRHRVR